MDYKIGDVVIRKEDKFNKYIFLGITDDESLNVVKDVKEVMGKEIEIGMYVTKPLCVHRDDDFDYIVKVIFSHVELFELEK